MSDTTLGANVYNSSDKEFTKIANFTIPDESHSEFYGAVAKLTEKGVKVEILTQKETHYSRFYQNILPNPLSAEATDVALYKRPEVALTFPSLTKSKNKRVAHALTNMTISGYDGEIIGKDKKSIENNIRLSITKTNSDTLIAGLYSIDEAMDKPLERTKRFFDPLRKRTLGILAIIAAPIFGHAIIAGSLLSLGIGVLFLGAMTLGEIERTALRKITSPTVPLRQRQRVIKNMDEVCKQAQVKTPHLYYQIAPKANAAAFTVFGRGRILVNSAILAEKRLPNFDGTAKNKFEDDELQGILAHELGHVRQKHLAFIRTYALFLQFGNIDAIGGALAFMGHWYVFYPWFASIYKMMRVVENAADKYAIKVTKNPMALARAFRKLGNLSVSDIENPPVKNKDVALWKKALGKPLLGLGRLLASHPTLQSRIKKCQKQARKMGISDDLRTVDELREAVERKAYSRPNPPEMLNEMDELFGGMAYGENRSKTSPVETLVITPEVKSKNINKTRIKLKDFINTNAESKFLAGQYQDISRKELQKLVASLQGQVDKLPDQFFTKSQKLEIEVQLDPKHKGKLTGTIIPTELLPEVPMEAIPFELFTSKYASDAKDIKADSGIEI